MAAVQDDARRVLLLGPDRALADVGFWRIMLGRCAEVASSRDGSAALWLTVDVETAMRMMSRWLLNLPKGSFKLRRQWIAIGDGAVVFRDFSRAWSVPHEQYDLVVLDHADRAGVEVPQAVDRLVRRSTARVVGIAGPVSVEHWCRSAPGWSRHEATWEAAVAAGSVSALEIDKMRAELSPGVFASRLGGASVSPRHPDADLSLRTFAERRLKIRTKARDIVPFTLYDLQQRYEAMKRLGRSRGFRRFILLKYRQGGFTTTEQAASYKLCATVANAKCATLAHLDESTKRIFTIVKRFHANDPKQPESLNAGNQKLLKLANGSEFFVGTAGSKGFGRSDTLDRFHGSEAAFWLHNNLDRIEELMAGLLGASKNGEGVLESTPNGINWFCHYYRDAKAGANGFWPIFLPWFLDPQYRDALPDGVAPEDFVRAGDAEEAAFVEKVRATWNRRISAEQLAWRRAAKKEFRRLFAQEYIEDDEGCFLASGSCYFDVDRIAALINALPDYEAGKVSGIVVSRVPGGVAVQFEPPMQTERYVIGADCSEGVQGSDPCGLGVLKATTGEQVYSLHGLFRPREFAEEIARVHRLYNGAFVGVERNNHGHAVIEKLIDAGVSGSGSLFHHEDGRPGWVTDSKSRPVMLAQLGDAIEDGSEHGMTVRDRMLLRECLTFKRQADGKFEADPGAHDDSVMKWAIAWQMRNVRPQGSRIWTA